MKGYILAVTKLARGLQAELAAHDVAMLVMGASSSESLDGQKNRLSGRSEDDPVEIV